MKKKWLALLLVVLILCGVLAWLVFKPGPTDKEQIEQVIENIKTAVEDKSPTQIMENISSDYKDESGLSYRKVNLLARQILRSVGQIKAEITDFSEPQIHGNSASVRMTVHVTASDGGQVSHDIHGQVTVTFRREGNWRKHWKIVSAEGWQPMAEGGYLE